MNSFRSQKRGDPPSERQSPTNYRSFQDDHDENLHQQPKTRSSLSRREGRLRSQTDNECHDNLRSSSNIDNYRGFSTSIHDMYRHVDMERVDCCAVTCCGVLQHDRDRYLLQGTTPPSPFKRIVVHLLMPLCIVLLAGLVATHVRDATLRLVSCWVLLGMLLLYAAQQAFKWRMKTMSVRKDLLYLKYQKLQHPRSSVLAIMEHHLPRVSSSEDDENENVTNRNHYLGQSEWDVSCAHPCCIIGCYRNDTTNTSTNNDYDRNNNNDDENHLCRCLWKHLCFSCCGLLPQCCGTCALAQEARELETELLPAACRRIDYVTMQAYMDYYPNIYDERWEQNSDGAARSRSWCCSFKCCSMPPLSRLSVRLLQGLLMLSLMLLAWSIGGRYYWRFVVGRRNKVIHFNIYNFGVYLAAWAQSIGLLALIVWFVNRRKPSELSIDALIKYFAAGFCLSTSLAVFWELVCSLIVKVFVTLVLLISGVGQAASPDEGATHFVSSPVNGFGAFFVPDETFRLAGAGIKDFVQAFGNDHPAFYTLYIMVTAFFLAAFIEELCKYFGYRMVEHPDFLSSRELTEARQIVLGENDNQNVDDEEANADGNRSERDSSYAKQGQSMQARGSAIMLAMVAVAIGFACCENLVYLFIYSKGSIQMQLTVLVSRSLFPVHPIAAALQSIGVCKRELEGVRNMKLGRIILPAVIFHGGYDFFILWIDFLARRHGTYANNDDGSDYASDDTSIIAVALSFVISLLSLFLALYYIWSEGGRQRQRLADMDRRDSVDRSSLI
ncbi:hypothetical protein MPSEU_000926200 [Mayamaea pseudoterrestris]|nr:hypothetical protein MPSEU_000926200 [Mayamaea pseudoterrestris]